MKTPRRFIAGAICPSCKKMDTLMMWSENNIPHRECMVCGFMDKLDETSTQPDTKIRQPKPTNTERAKAIRFFPNPKLDKKPHQ